MSLLIMYRPYILIAALVGMIFLPIEWRKRKLFIITAFLLAFSAGYELIMEEAVTKMPGRINRALNEKGPEKSENVKYYKKPDF
ncbi:hypothetical protein [Candidatus Electronema sp. JM]|uniref:hypothetical protein n=1 Tax=Candidatus Electronema sp. JM TaxID=3401571 RepID=UPI003AA93A11